MSLSQISLNSIIEEEQVQKKIFNEINSYQNIIFNAGAGAGKTHALRESLKYIIETKGEKLSYHNQNVICITYTNVATNKIKEKLGNTELVKISTIHERLWELIKDYQKQLVEIHVEKLNKDLIKLKDELETESKFQEYRNLWNKDDFVNTMIQNKNIYYKSVNKSASVFRERMNLFLNNCDAILRNVSNFKDLIRKIYRIKNYEDCLLKIRSKINKLITYDSKYNVDRLHKMMISHETLLEYSYKIIEKYDLIKQVIIDKYPYILVDEYQDTDEKVVKILKLLSDYSEYINHKFCIGYFGDTAQSIYEKGIGSQILEINPSLTSIDKKYNRRSTNEIIEVINKIRNDDIVQESIYSDANGGSVKFYQGNEDHIDNFIEKYKIEWNISQNNKLHCLVLTNELVAKYNKFENIYQKLKVTEYYRINWKNRGTEILSHDLLKLGKIPSLLYRFIDFKRKIENQKTLIIEIIKEDIYRDITFTELKKVIKLLKSINGESLKTFIQSIFQIYNETEDKNYKKIIEELLELETYTFDNVIEYMLNSLFPNVEDSDFESSKEKLIELLEVDYIEYIYWFDFINKAEKKDVIFHTYHGTKGEEYKNVIILMQDDFGTERNKFSSYFTNYADTSNLNSEELIKFTNTKNLLYVSCSRAIKNLRILYLDEVLSFSGGIEAIFDNIIELR